MPNALHSFRSDCRRALGALECTDTTQCASFYEHSPHWPNTRGSSSANSSADGRHWAYHPDMYKTILRSLVSLVVGPADCDSSWLDDLPAPTSPQLHESTTATAFVHVLCRTVVAESLEQDGRGQQDLESEQREGQGRLEQAIEWAGTSIAEEFSFNTVDKVEPILPPSFVCLVCASH